MKRLLIASAAFVAALSMGGCALTGSAGMTTGTGTTTTTTASSTVQNWQTMVSMLRTGVTTAEAAETTICSVPSAPTFCTNATDQAKITALESDVNSALTALSDALAAYQTGGSQAALVAAMNDLTLALASYNSTVTAFRAAK